jgi:DnaK suppressor protein
MGKAKSIDVSRFTGKKKKSYEALTQLRDNLLRQMQTLRDDALDCSSSDKRGITTHMAELGSDNSRHEMDVQLLTEEGNMLELVEAAINRLLNDEYGICSDCCKAISDARLEAKPYTDYCINCKSIRENNSGMNPNLD